MRTILSNTFTAFFESEKSSGVVLLVCTILSLAIANSSFGPAYGAFWQMPLGTLTLSDWINDALMAIFFLFVGLELEREVYVGELSDFRGALLPIVAAGGGMIGPALIHFVFNAGTPTQPGAGIPMATDIAFALGALALLGSRIPASLKVFLAAVAVIDDLGAVIVIAIFYASDLSIVYLFAALSTFAAMAVLNRFFRVMSLTPYLVGGALMWFFMLKSGVHATIAGVLLAFAIPFTSKSEDRTSPSHRLENFLHRPVAFGVLPIFALANTGIVIGAQWGQELVSLNSLGIIAGLIVGKPLGITLASLTFVYLGVCKLPSDLAWRHVIGAGLLGGIGFTMSIFIANLAFGANAPVIDASKLAILLASLAAGFMGLAWLRFCDGGRRPAA